MARVYGGNRRSHATTTVGTGVAVLENEVEVLKTAPQVINRAGAEREITIQSGKGNLINDSVEIHMASRDEPIAVVVEPTVEPVVTPTKKGKK